MDLTAKQYVMLKNAMDTMSVVGILFVVTGGLLFSRAFLAGILLMVTGLTIVVISIIVSGRLEKKVFQIRKWRALVNKNFASFPMTELERLALIPWAEKTLCDEADLATRLFENRDKDYVARTLFLDEITKKGIRPDNLAGDLRDELKRHKTNCRLAERSASARYQEYLSLWDLLKDLTMLPCEKTGVVWKDPEKFRVFVKTIKNTKQSVVT